MKICGVVAHRFLEKSELEKQYYEPEQVDFNVAVASVYKDKQYNIFCSNFGFQDLLK